MTYSKRKGYPNIDWNDILNDTSSLISNYSYYSKSWVTCAVGNQCLSIPRDLFGGPKDSELYRLGELFHKAVSSDDRIKAKEILSEIEKRSIEILNNLK